MSYSAHLHRIRAIQSSSDTGCPKCVVQLTPPLPGVVGLNSPSCIEVARCLGVGCIALTPRGGVFLAELDGQNYPYFYASSRSMKSEWYERAISTDAPRTLLR
jgi:hypothetical protein